MYNGLGNLVQFEYSVLERYEQTGFFKFIVPNDGIYLLQAVGAQGGNANPRAGGRGAMIGGHFNLTKGDVLRIGVGGKGEDGSYKSTVRNYVKATGGGGGGASSVVKVNGDFDSLSNEDNTKLVIAGGGGGA